MRVPLEISFRGVRKTEAIESLIYEKVAKLEKICNYITSCHIAIEKTQQHQQTANPFRVRIDMRIPPNHELVAKRESNNGGGDHEELVTVIHDTFDAARRQLQKLVEKQRENIKIHFTNESNGIVSKLFPDQGYGFIEDIADGTEVYFHSNSVLHSDFDRLDIGTGVHYVREEGEKGPQASTVLVIDKSGVRNSDLKGNDYITS